MPARDKIHQHVVDALDNDDWTILDDPLILQHEKTIAYVDLEAERVLTAEKGSKKIAVEIKSFLSPSFLSDVEDALGQYLLYRTFLSFLDMSHELYLAISTITHQTLSKNEMLQTLLDENRVSIIVVDLDKRKVTEWIQR